MCEDSVEGKVAKASSGEDCGMGGETMRGLFFGTSRSSGMSPDSVMIISIPFKSDTELDVDT